KDGTPDVLDAGPNQHVPEIIFLPHPWVAKIPWIPDRVQVLRRGLRHRIPQMLRPGHQAIRAGGNALDLWANARIDQCGHPVMVDRAARPAPLSIRSARSRA